MSPSCRWPRRCPAATPRGMLDIYLHDRHDGPDRARQRLDCRHGRERGERLRAASAPTAATSRSTRRPPIWPPVTPTTTNDVFVRDRQTRHHDAPQREQSRASRATPAAGSRRSAPTGGSSPSTRRRRTWCRTTPTAASTCSCATCRPARRPASAWAPAARRPTGTRWAGSAKTAGSRSSARTHPTWSAGDTNGRGDAFVHDRQTGQTTRVSVSSTGAQGDGDSGDADRSAPMDDMSCSGRRRPTWCQATPTACQTCSSTTVRRARPCASTWRRTAPRPTPSAPADEDGCCPFPSLSADGRSAVVATLASNLVPGDTNALDDIFVVGPISVGPTAIDVPGTGGNGTVNVAFAYAGTAWTATTTAPWIDDQRAGRRIGERNGHIHGRAQHRHRRQRPAPSSWR